LPGVDELLAQSEAAPLVRKYSRGQVVEALRTVLDETRAGILASGSTEGAGLERGADHEVGTVPREPRAAGSFFEAAGQLLETWCSPRLRRVLNLTGVVIHTNLGRSPLAKQAVERVAEVAASYSTMEYDLETGRRGRREAAVEALLKRLTGAEDALVVNNNAAAVLLLLMALAHGREVVVSRGQLVEIGGSFRMPDIMRASGARLVEVGTTNRTRVGDYEEAITSETAMLLHVHTSNYRIMGFAEETELRELAELGRRRNLPVIDDLGSGALLELPAFATEPTVKASLRAGADVVCFSGDKLLGGPQAGVLLGGAALIERLRGHPVARALRLDKMTLAALEATLLLYLHPEKALREIPTLRYLSRSAKETQVLAEALRAAIELPNGGLILEVEQSSALAGGGSMPLVELPSHAVRIRMPEWAPDLGAEATRLSASKLEQWLRKAPVPVIARVSQDSLQLDVLALDESDIDQVAAGVAWAVAAIEGLEPPA